MYTLFIYLFIFSFSRLCCFSVVIIWLVAVPCTKSAIYLLMDTLRYLGDSS